MSGVRALSTEELVAASVTETPAPLNKSQYLLHDLGGESLSLAQICFRYSGIVVTLLKQARPCGDFERISVVTDCRKRGTQALKSRFLLSVLASPGQHFFFHPIYSVV
jgi:hypothetical protein